MPEHSSVDVITGHAKAVISDDGRYRYLLERRWEPLTASLPRTMTFVMLNPSTADAEQDDPTIRRCIGFAKREGCGRLLVSNLFAYRATNPKALWHLTVEEARGPDLHHHLATAMALADVLVFAWGASLVERRAGRHLFRLPRPAVESFARDAGCPAPQCLGVTATGQPRHPLYVPAATPLTLWRPT